MDTVPLYQDDDQGKARFVRDTMLNEWVGKE